MIPSARIMTGRWRVALLIPVVLICMAWTARHITNVLDDHLSGRAGFASLWAFTFLFLIWHLALAWTETPYQVRTARQQRYLDALSVTVNVPAYNEDPATLRRSLESLLAQTRPVQQISVVDDGSSVDLSPVREWLLAQAPANTTLLSWQRTTNAGKRNAQLLTLRESTSDIFITIDSDTIISATGIEEGLKPFLDPAVMSVAPIILAYNLNSWLVRLTDAWLLTFQVTVRAAMGRLGCVLVNSGNFALYRTAVIQAAIPAYEKETFAGRPVQFSDDSLLTLFAHLNGKTVQQPSSFAFTVLPERLSHHLRQQLRWMRGSTIRSIWRFRYLPLRGYAYWEHLMAWVNFVLITFAFIYLVLLRPVLSHRLAPSMLLFSVLVAYLTSLRYLTIRRSDQSVPAQLLSWLLAPLMLAWTALVLRPLRLYAIATCWRTGWNTRHTVEVTTKDAPARMAGPLPVAEPTPTLT